MSVQYDIAGITDEVTTCGCCGRQNLKRTVVLAVLDADGNRTGEYHYVGTHCASLVTGWTQRTTQRRIEQAIWKERERKRAIAEWRRVQRRAREHAAENANRTEEERLKATRTRLSMIYQAHNDLRANDATEVLLEPGKVFANRDERERMHAWVREYTALRDTVAAIDSLGGLQQAVNIWRELGCPSAHNPD